MSKDLVDVIADMKEEEALRLVKEMVESGSESIAILDAAREAMDIVKPDLAKLPETECHGRVSSAPSRETFTISVRTS